MSYNINICFNLFGRVEILFGKLLHSSSSICHPYRQDCKRNRLTQRDVLIVWKTYCVSYFSFLYCKEHIWGHSFFYALSDKILYSGWAKYHCSKSNIFNTALGYSALIKTTITCKQLITCNSKQIQETQQKKIMRLRLLWGEQYFPGYTLRLLARSIQTGCLKKLLCVSFMVKLY